jgi:hypothetical protein
MVFIHEVDKIQIISIESHQFDERLKKTSRSISDILSEIWGGGKKFTF